ncbi:hypothetical protein KAW48_01745 [candidate division WOR-3 bacterium]|nr:hypothetical protein [candidate division WOR-3 bacterium]
MKKLLPVLILALLVTFSLNAVDVEWHGLFYDYAFMWMNADFDSDVEDSDMHYYIHADINAKADFGEGVTGFIKIGDWGNFGRHPITGSGLAGMNVHIMHAYVSAQKLFGTPLGLTIGIIPVLYGDIAFDGGEDGFTGLKFNVNTEQFTLDLFTYRAVENGGMGYMFNGAYDSIPADLDLTGAWATLKLMEGKVELNGFGFYRTEGEDKPMWGGVRSAGSPMEGLCYVGDFVMMFGSDAADVDYKGMYYSARGTYTMDPVSFGGGYYYFSGENAEEGNQAYQSPTWGPYVNGFYKGWPGFGPAYTLRSPYGFNLVTPDLSVINGHLGYKAEAFGIRADFFMYSKVEGDPTAMGNEIALHTTFALNDQFSIGATGGYWMPGDAFTGEDAMMAGYLYLAKGF